MKMERSDNKAKILFVDDEPKILNGIRRTLVQRQKEWDMTFLPSGSEALAHLSQFQVDVLVTDIAMPGISGLGLVKKANADHPSTQCIVLTGTADLKLAEQLINSASVFRFYTKPYSADLLSEGIADAIGSQRNVSAISLLQEAGNLEKGVLNKIPTGVLVAASDGQIQFMNQSAANTLNKNNVVGLGNDDRLKGQTPDQTNEILDLLKDVTTSNMEETRGLTLVDPEGGESLLFIFSAYRSNAVLIFITDPSETPLPDAKLIGELFGLTASESNLAERLVKGDSVKEAAVHLGLTEQSVRTYLKNVLSKMSVRRQSELISRILSTSLPSKKALTDNS